MPVIVIDKNHKKRKKKLTKKKKKINYVKIFLLVLIVFFAFQIYRQITFYKEIEAIHKQYMEEILSLNEEYEYKTQILDQIENKLNNDN
jgi:hypothetical protein